MVPNFVFKAPRARAEARALSPRLAALVLLLSSLRFSAPADAAPDPSELLIRQGVELRRASRDTEALEKFQRAYDMAHTPRAAAQLGLCEQAVEKWLDADGHLTEALTAESDPWVSRNRRTLETAIEDVRKHLATLSIFGSPGTAQVSVNGTLVAILSDKPSVRVPPGHSALSVAAPGFESFAATYQLEPGQTRAVEVNLVSPVQSQVSALTPPDTSLSPSIPAPPESAPSKPAASWTKSVGIGALVAGGLGLTLGVASHIAREGKASDFNAATSGCDRTNGIVTGGASCDQLAQDYDALGTRMVLGYAIGGLFAAGGTALLLWPRGDKSQAPTPGTDQALTCGPGLASFSISCTGTY
ncbi:MAG: hypothetical protein KA712_02730 [Myxococcales bacterium]|nr:hypothetical protein [Myxococcales bacterium]